MWESLTSVVSGLEPVSLIIGGLVGAGLSTWMNFYVTRPLLKHTGSSGGGGQAYKCSSASITNVQGFLGIRIPETILFGLPIHRQFELGLALDRQPSRQCQAWLYDKGSKKAVTNLLWRIPGNPSQFSSLIDIGPNDSASLMLFCGTGINPKKYFPFKPVGNDSNDPKIPEEDAQIEGTHEFYVDIRSHGRRVLRFDVKMERNMDGRLYLYHGERGRMGGGTF